MSRAFSNEALRRVLSQPVTVSVEYPDRDTGCVDDNGRNILSKPVVNDHIIRINSIYGDHLLQECLAVLNQLERLQADHDALRKAIAALGKAGTQ